MPLVGTTFPHMRPLGSWQSAKRRLMHYRGTLGVDTIRGLLLL